MRQGVLFAIECEIDGVLLLLGCDAEAFEADLAVEAGLPVILHIGQGHSVMRSFGS